ncbi:MAG: peptidase [Verrucomicrobiales bacterium]|nr:peptidase [Verrucomicrobiales bacterium]
MTLTIGPLPACLGALILAVTPPAATPSQLPPTELRGLRQTESFYPQAEWNPTVPAAESVLGFPLAERAATPEQVVECLKLWAAAAPDRCRLVEYARSHEDRPLHYMLVTSPANLARLDEIQAGTRRLADPWGLGDTEAERLIADLPAVAWLGHTIHGDETEGSDAALATLHYLIGSDDPEARRLREQLVVIVDPLMNPDGRGRFLKMVAEHRGTSPNVDDQSLLHTGYWPRGRGNHYLFDLNRDAILGVHPETRGRIRAIAEWNPVLLVDAHGMGAQDTHLFSPPREPVNPNHPASKPRWARLFAADQARAFDRHHLVYYTGEWNEEWYPGYTDGYASLRGAVGILYEQARIAEDGVRRPEGRILSYRESVQHHVIGELANLTTAANHRADLLRNFLSIRREAVAEEGPYANRTFAILPDPNRSRREAFLGLMRLQGFQMFEVAEPLTVAVAVDQLGHDQTDITVPAGTVLLPNRQPLAHLLAAMLEFDPRFTTNVLADERRELLLKGGSKIYDTTAWNLTLFHGLASLMLKSPLPPGVRPLVSLEETASAIGGATQAPVAWVIDGADDASVTVAARLMERGVEIRVADKAFVFDDRPFARGSVVVTALDNREFEGELQQTVALSASEANVTAVGVAGGLGEGDLPDLGGEHFQRMEPPRIALLGREESSPYDYGSTWHLLDHQLGVRHSQLAGLGRGDLGRYNVIILPGGRPDLPASLKEWIRAGGTLIATSSAAGALADGDAGWGQARVLGDVLGQLDDYELAVFREWLARQSPLPTTAAIWAHAPDSELKYPWQTLGGGRPDEKELKRRDAWQSLFMPQGAFVAARCNTNHWLTFGCGEWLPVLVGDAPMLMAKGGVEAPIRYGVFENNGCARAADPAEEKDSPAPEAGDKDDEVSKSGPKSRVGWAALPPDTTLRLRLSGLLWPEAAHRIANAAWCTRERYGRGQIILFATSPTFRGTSQATARIYLNAIVYGPGWGAAQPVRP